MKLIVIFYFGLLYSSVSLNKFTQTNLLLKLFRLLHRTLKIIKHMITFFILRRWRLRRRITSHTTGLSLKTSFFCFLLSKAQSREASLWQQQDVWLCAALLLVLQPAACLLLSGSWKHPAGRRPTHRDLLPVRHRSVTLVPSESSPGPESPVNRSTDQVHRPRPHPESSLWFSSDKDSVWIKLFC